MKLRIKRTTKRSDRAFGNWLDGVLKETKKELDWQEGKEI